MAKRHGATARKIESERADDTETLVELIGETGFEAMTTVSPAKVADLLDKWCDKATIDLADDEEAWRQGQAIALAGYLTMFTSSLAGVSPVDRFIRERRAKADSNLHAALDSLARAEFRLLRIRSRESARRLLVEDLASGESFSLFDSDLPDHAAQLDVGAWLAPLPTGGFVSIGPVLPLDGAALAEGLSFARPGKGLANPKRCAAAVYRPATRHGGPKIEGVNYFAESLVDDEIADLDDGPPDPLHALAGIFAQTKGDAPAEAVRDAREHAAAPFIVETLGRGVIMKRRGDAILAEAYSRIAYIMIETLDRRISAGYVREIRSLADMAVYVDRSIEIAGAPEEIRALFDELRRRVVSARGAKASRGADDELARVLQRIRALRAKTVDQGCTEEEALASARKVAELLDRYGLTLGEVELRDQPCEGVGVDTGRKRRAPIDECAPAVAEFCDCRIWFEKTPEGVIRFVFFGLPADVAAAHYLHDLVVLAFDSETAAFKKANRAAGPKASARSFQLGLAHGVAFKLRSLKDERDAAMRSSNGRELTPVKTAVIEDELEKLGLAFNAKPHGRSRKVAANSYEAGLAAGHKFEPRLGVETG